MSEKFVVEFDFKPGDKVVIDGDQEAVIDNCSVADTGARNYYCEWFDVDKGGNGKWFSAKRLTLK